MQISTTIYVGLNDKISDKQIIPTPAARDYILQSLFNAGFCYATITESIGAYKYQAGANAGKIAREPGLCIEIIEPMRATLRNRRNLATAVNNIKIALNQESIAIKRALCLFNCR